MKHTVTRKGGWWACTCGEGGKGTGRGHAPRVKDKGLTFVFPPGTWADPPPDRRRWNAAIVQPPVVARLQECQKQPGCWSLICASNRPDNLAWRIRNKGFAVTRTGRWDACQRALPYQPGFAEIYARCWET